VRPRRHRVRACLRGWGRPSATGGLRHSVAQPAASGGLLRPTERGAEPTGPLAAGDSEQNSLMSPGDIKLLNYMSMELIISVAGGTYTSLACTAEGQGEGAGRRERVTSAVPSLGIKDADVVMICY